MPVTRSQSKTLKVKPNVAAALARYRMERETKSLKCSSGTTRVKAHTRSNGQKVKAHCRRKPARRRAHSGEYVSLP